MKTKSVFLYLAFMFIISISCVVFSSYNTRGYASRVSVSYFSEVIVTINSIENISSTTADFNYNVRVINTGDDKIRITETGANVSKVPLTKAPAGPPKKFIGRATTGNDYKTKLTGLLPGTKYYVTAYAISSGGTVQSTKQVFETKPN